MGSSIFFLVVSGGVMGVRINCLKARLRGLVLHQPDNFIVKYEKRRDPYPGILAPYLPESVSVIADNCHMPSIPPSMTSRR
ncbi:hypothetical protein JXO59_13225 [candidate division KSB1 bacterium]|nr:hypothetical protein [candidate division KSB1 bacterium]